MVQLIPLHAKTTSSLASYKSRLILPFWYQLLNGCNSSSSYFIHDKIALAGSTHWKDAVIATVKLLNYDKNAVRDFTLSPSMSHGLTDQQIQWLKNYPRRQQDLFRNMFVRIDTRHSMSFMTWLSLNWKHKIHISWLVCRHKHNLKCLYVPGFDKSLTPSHRKPLHYLLIMPLMIGCLRILKNYYYTCHQCCTNSQFRFYQATAMVNRYAINNTKSLVSKLLKICID